MSIVSVQPKSFILALFIRDDNERFLLGDNGYDFKDSQLHFAANTIENDEVQKQGADGVMIAGQVRRASVQSFDGFVGDATMAKETIEQMRRDFIAFFLKGHHYRVIYVDCNRNAWQRKGGYLVDAPEVKELWQIHPEYHVGLNFEDVNYYSYDEDADGNEILANLVNVPVSTEIEGGLVWDEDGAVSEDAGDIYYDTAESSASGKSIAISDATEAPLASFQLDGETSQNGTPTPSAPVAVNTTTGENVVQICGKNLLEYKSRFMPYSNYGLTTTMDAETGIITINGTFTGTSAKDIALIANSVSINIFQNNSYYIGIKYISGSKTGDSNFTARTVLSSGSYYWNNAVPLVHEDRSVLCNINNAVRFDTIRFFVPVGATFNNYKILPYINANETGYEPYQGQSYTISLGSIELCKIGDYQDYIYKSGDKWYVHKEVLSVTLDGTESWIERSNTGADVFKFRNKQPVLQANIKSNTSLLCSHFPANNGANNPSYNNVAICGYANTSGWEKYLIISIWKSLASTIDDAKTWLSQNTPSVYYALATPTDTEITNEALITQLDNVASAPLYTGVNNITTITPNEQGTLEISYYTKYQPMVGSGGYVWEAGGAGGPTVIINNSIDNVSPVWTIYGPTTNPQLENATTGETIEYVGTIAQGQTLTIDMGEQTASLDGLNVISNLVGDFIQLAPGRNNMIYSVSGEAGASELGWSEIVG